MHPATNTSSRINAAHYVRVRCSSRRTASAVPIPECMHGWLASIDSAIFESFAAMMKLDPNELAATVGRAMPASKGLEGKELAQMQRAMGIRASTPKRPYIDERGHWVLPSLTPTEHRALAARGKR